MSVSRDRLSEFRRNPAKADLKKKSLYRHSDTYHDPAASVFYHPPVQLPMSHVNQAHGYRFDNDIPISPRENTPVSSTESFFIKIEDTRELISSINRNVTEIESLHAASLSGNNCLRATDTKSSLDDLMNQTRTLNLQARNSIKETELESLKTKLDPAEAEMRKIQLRALKKRFIETIQRYQDIERTFQKKQKQLIERQILIVKPDATPHEIEATIDSAEAPHIFAQSILNANRSGNATQVLNEVQSRHQDIKKIEKTIMELHQLFLDMQAIVELQQEKITEVEQTSEKVIYDLEQGQKHVSIAIKTAQKTRKRKVVCLSIFLIIVLVAAGLLTWWFGFPQSHRPY